MTSTPGSARTCRPWDLQSALHLAESLGPAGEAYLGRLYLNLGYVLRQQGDFRQALTRFNQALSVLVARQETHWIATTELNIAAILQAQGHYKQALRLLHTVQERTREKSPLQLADAQHNMVICYLALNRDREARDLAQQVVQAYDALAAHYARGRALFNLATAEAALSNVDAALAVLDEAERIMRELDTPLWLVTVCLWRGNFALKRGEASLALQQLNAAAQYLARNAQHMAETDVYLLRGQVLLDIQDYPGAIEMGQQALHHTQHTHQAWERYSAHLLLGRVREAQHDLTRARRHYTAATATINRMQRGLTITLRPEFMADKGEATRALIRLHLSAGETARAFETLERSKSQIFLNYLTSRETLRWNTAIPQVRALQAELKRLREEHQWLCHQTQHDGSALDGAAPDNTALEAIRLREKQMRAITEQLYLYSPDDGLVDLSRLPALAEVQRHLPDGTLLIAFYNDGSHLFAFKIARRAIDVVALDTPGATVDGLLAQLEFNLACALKVEPGAPIVGGLARLAQQVGQQLFEALLAPLAIRFADWQRLVIVPYGSLHYLPFHILYDQDAYLIERCEVVTLPAAALLTRQGPVRTGGALVLAHSQQGLLAHTLREAEAVHELLGGEILRDELANQDALRLPPRQVLHIAAHGEFRIDQPDLAYIALADGRLYTDDFLQHDLGYELITLSACETGRANVLAGEELIGLGRGDCMPGQARCW